MIWDHLQQHRINWSETLIPAVEFVRFYVKEKRKVEFVRFYVKEMKS
jgi:hypothetical protein